MAEEGETSAAARIAAHAQPDDAGGETSIRQTRPRSKPGRPQLRDRDPRVVGVHASNSASICFLSQTALLCGSAGGSRCLAWITTYPSQESEPKPVVADQFTGPS